jgi:hypothetical protein
MPYIDEMLFGSAVKALHAMLISMHCDHIVETPYRVTTVPLSSRKSSKCDAIRTFALLVGRLSCLAGERFPQLLA